MTTTTIMMKTMTMTMMTTKTTTMTTTNTTTTTTTMMMTMTTMATTTMAMRMTTMTRTMTRMMTRTTTMTTMTTMTKRCSWHHCFDVYVPQCIKTQYLFHVFPCRSFGEGWLGLWKQVFLTITIVHGTAEEWGESPLNHDEHWCIKFFQSTHHGQHADVLGADDARCNH